MRALKLMRASAMQIHAIRGWGCACNFFEEKMVIATKRRPMIERPKSPA